MDKCVVERSEDVADAEDKLALFDLWAERDIFCHWGFCDCAKWRVSASAHVGEAV